MTEKGAGAIWRSVALLALLAGGIAAWFVWRSPAGEPAADAGRFVSVERGDIERVVTAQGKLEPREYVDVGAQVSGQLKSLHVEIGDVVKRGTLLAEIDPRVYEAKVQADEARLETLAAQLAEQEAQIKLSRQIFERNERLLREDAVSREVHEDSETALAVAEARAKSLAAQIKEARSALDGDRTNLGYTKIYAPIDGTVVEQPAREGQTLNATQQTPVIVRVANLDAMTVRAQVAEADIADIAPGAAAYFTTLGGPERRWEGTVRQILPSPELINQVVLYNALIEVDNHDRRLLTGMSAQVFFVLGEAHDVPLIPLAVFGPRKPTTGEPESTRRNVRVRTPKGVETREIELGLSNRLQVEVRSGLAAGEEVELPVQEAAAESPSTGL